MSNTEERSSLGYAQWRWWDLLSVSEQEAIIREVYSQQEAGIFPATTDLLDKYSLPHGKD